MLPVVSGYHNKVKDLTDIEQSGYTTKAIIYVSKTYGARVIVSKEIINECVNIFLDQFNQLGVSEILEAYRLWSTDQLDIKGSAEMYGGEFNAAQFGKIISAYVEYRKQILAAYLTAKHNEQFEAEKIAMQEKRKQRFEESFNEMFLNADFEQWEDVPAFWCDAARERGLMTIKKEDGLRIFEKAKKLAIIKIEEEKAERQNIFSTVANEGDRAKVIAKQLAVFEHLQNIKK